MDKDNSSIYLVARLQIWELFERPRFVLRTAHYYGGIRQEFEDIRRIIDSLVLGVVEFGYNGDIGAPEMTTLNPNVQPEEEITGLSYFLPQAQMPTWKEANDVISNFQFFNHFPDEAAAVKFYEDHRFRKGLYCPRCGGTNAYRKKSGKPLNFRCRDCDRYFSVRIGTPLENSNLTVRAWLYCIHLLLTSRKGEPAIKMMKSVGVSYDTAWFLFHRIRRLMTYQRIERLGGTVQIDLAFLGGKFPNMHTYKKERFANWRGNKIPVAGIRNQDGQIILEQLPDFEGDTLIDFVLRRIEPGSTVWSDEEETLKVLEHLGFVHRSISHNAKQYVDPVTGVTTNAIEGIWSILKRTYTGTHHYMSEKHAQLYLDELACRHNGGYGNGPASIGRILDIAEGKKFPWEELTGKKRHRRE